MSEADRVTGIRYYRNNGIERCTMMFDYLAHTGERKFAASRFVLIADEVIRFYD